MFTKMEQAIKSEHNKFHTFLNRFENIKYNVKKLFGTSGIRMKFNKDILDVVGNVSRVLSTYNDKILIGMDTRTTSQIIKNIIISNVLSSGSHIFDAGCVPTPVIGYNTHKYTRGIMITASHNPEEYNGIKLFNKDGSSLLKKQQEDIEIAYGHENFTEWNKIGKYFTTNSLDDYIEFISTEIFINRKDIKVVLDCGNGAGCYATPRILENNEINTLHINCNPSGYFSRGSEPIEENLSHIPPLIKSCNMHGGIAHDGDADRMVAFDDSGRFITGDNLLLLFIKYLNSHNVVTTYDASMAIDEVVKTRRVPVGDTYVSEELTKWGDFGGEPSGVMIYPKISKCPDGIYSAGLFCAMIEDMDMNLSKEIDKLPKYKTLRTSFTCNNAVEILNRLGSENPTDGLRIEESGGWYLIRASGTEPKIRITAEGKTKEIAEKLMKKGKEKIKTF